MEIQIHSPDEAVIEVVKDHVERYEKQRPNARNMLFIRVPIFLTVSVAAWIFIAKVLLFDIAPQSALAKGVAGLVVFASLLLISVAYSIATRPAVRLRQSFRDGLYPKIFGNIQDFHYANGVIPKSFSRIPGDATGKFTTKSFDDVVTGRYKGFPFELYEAELFQKVGKSFAVAFRGVICAFEMIVPFPGGADRDQARGHALEARHRQGRRGAG